jgi:DNA polymerase V
LATATSWWSTARCQPRHGCIVIAEVDNDFTVKYLHQRAGRIKLRAALTRRSPTSSPKTGSTLTVVGVVTAVIKQFR